jgi:CMP-N,N'-diacetyllegionaminic acid synthase
MYKNNRILAVIPARAGSKRIKNKNTRLAGGKPLIAWTIEQANKSQLIDRLILSSEDPEICSIAAKYQCEVPFLRPQELAEDDSTSVDVILHVLSKVDNYDYVVMLQPTSPFRESKDIDDCISCCIDNFANACISMTEVEKTPHWMYYISHDGKLSPIIDKDKVKPNYWPQVDQAYVLNGAIYIVKIDWFLEYKTFLSNETIGFIMPRNRSLDVDTILDWDLMELLFLKNYGVENF